MKLYVQDGGWQGAAIFVANSADQAAEFANAMGYKVKAGRLSRDYEPSDFDEYELKPGLILETLGDY